MNNTNGNSILKLLGVIVLAIFVLWLISAIISGNGIGFGFNSGYLGEHMNGNYGMGNYGMGNYGTGTQVTNIISSMLFFSIKLLIVFFILSLILGLLIAIKRYVFNNDDIQKIKGFLTRDYNSITKETCSNCTAELNDQWKVCPFCGNEKEKIKV